MPADPFTFQAAPQHAIGRAAFTAVRPLLSWVLRAGDFRELYERLPRETGRSFDELALEALHIAVRCDAPDVARIPSSGPLIIAANHPHGAVDGLALAATLRRARPDVRLLANHLLARIPELRGSCFFVDPFERSSAAMRSQAGLRAAHLWLRQGGALAVFPSGEVSPRCVAGVPVDSDWRPTIGRLAIQSGAAILPAHIAGSNSWLFYAAGRVHPLLRTALLARELLKKRGQSITIRIGEARTHKGDGLRGAASTRAAIITAGVRRSVDELACSTKVVRSEAMIAADIAALSPHAKLAVNGVFDVFAATAEQIPSALHEIGRLRAVTYRAAGEGNDKEIDTDIFDRAYLHLFTWDRDAQRIVGAYRIGRTDRLVEDGGVAALYTRTLFRFSAEFIHRLTPALELGRSFVRVEYQRHPTALLALWKGIGAYVVRNPQYRFLFGPVSISARHSDASRGLLAAFLEQNHLDSVLAGMVEPFHPRPRTPGIASVATIPTSVDEANRLVSSLEDDGKGMPVLLRQYLKLNARLIGFNVDPSFGDVLDALMLVDLARVDRGLLTRYFGRDGAATFLAHHAVERRAGAAA
jgi:putative hemolysin